MNVRIKVRMMLLIIGMTFVSPWLSLFMSIVTRSIFIEYRKYRMKWFPLYSALILAIIAYCTYNSAFGDFYILTYILAKIEDQPLKAYALPEISKSIGPFNWIFFIIAKSKDYALMCMIPGMIVYYVYAKISSSVAVENGSRYREFVANYFIGLLLLQFFSILEHGRFIMAGAILIYAVYRELYVGKKNICTAILYILPLCFHLGILPLYAFRMVVKIFSKFKCLWLPTVIITYVLIMYSGTFFSFLPYALYNYIEKARIFFAGGSEWGQYVFSGSLFYILLRVFFDITFILLFFLLNGLEKNKTLCEESKKSKGKKHFLNFIMQLIYFSFITNFIVSDAFWRYGTLLFILIPMLLFYAQRYFSHLKYRLFQACIGGLGLIIFSMHGAMVIKNNILPYIPFFKTAFNFNMIHIIFRDFGEILF